MKKSVLLPALGLLAFAAGAQEVGQVISSVPVIQQVAVPRQVCGQQQTIVQQPNTGAGAVVGAIAGGAIGNTIGHGGGRAAATALGVIGGAVLGNNIEGSGPRQVQSVTQCTTQTFYESRTVGYNVTYEYAGRQHTVQLPYDPGPTIQLQVTPVGAAEPSAPPPMAAAPVVTAPTIIESSTVYVPQAPVYYYPPPPPRPFYPRPYYYAPPAGVSLELGYHRHRH